MISFSIAAQISPLAVALNKHGSCNAVPRAPSQTIASQITSNTCLFRPLAVLPPVTVGKWISLNDVAEFVGSRNK